jgi:hypothetical protein
MKADRVIAGAAAVVLARSFGDGTGNEVPPFAQHECDGVARARPSKISLVSRAESLCCPSPVRMLRLAV